MAAKAVMREENWFRDDLVCEIGEEAPVQSDCRAVIFWTAFRARQHKPAGWMRWLIQLFDIAPTEHGRL